MDTAILDISETVRQALSGDTAAFARIALKLIGNNKDMTKLYGDDLR